jgi:hypothetical protein
MPFEKKAIKNSVFNDYDDYGFDRLTFIIIGAGLGYFDII